MVGSPLKSGPMETADIITVGIDVGGTRKGFHSVALRGGHYWDKCSTANVQELAHWCHNTVNARVIGVDAPCRWSIDGHSRSAERQLMQMGISCFSTPTRQSAVEHPQNYYGWMLKGEELFQALLPRFPLLQNFPSDKKTFCFETYPHAITWHLRGGNALARQKRAQRQELLTGVGIDLSQLTNIDLVDAALCAFTAYHAATGRDCACFGEAETGLILVPARTNP